MAQPFSMLPEDEYRQLLDDIRKRGQQVPIIVNQHDEIIDGHNRKKACDELGIECLKVVQHFDNKDEELVQSLRVNLNRRHLDAEGKRKAMEALFRLDPTRSNRDVAREVGAAPGTAASVRASLEATDQIGQLDRTVGRDGKSRPLKRARPADGTIASAPKPLPGPVGDKQTVVIRGLFTKTGMIDDLASVRADLDRQCAANAFVLFTAPVTRLAEVLKALRALGCEPERLTLVADTKPQIAMVYGRRGVPAFEQEPYPCARREELQDIIRSLPNPQANITAGEPAASEAPADQVPIDAPPVVAYAHEPEDTATAAAERIPPAFGAVPQTVVPLHEVEGAGEQSDGMDQYEAQWSAEEARDAELEETPWDVFLG